MLDRAEIELRRNEFEKETLEREIRSLELSIEETLYHKHLAFLEAESLIGQMLDSERQLQQRLAARMAMPESQRESELILKRRYEHTRLSLFTQSKGHEVRMLEGETNLAQHEAEIKLRKDRLAILDEQISRSRGIVSDLKRIYQRNDWPAAVDESLICEETEDDKVDRAVSILEDFMYVDISDKTFLDFGCGQGHVVKEAHKLGAKAAVGFDIVQDGDFEWEKDEGGLLTVDLEKVKVKAPYDYILLYDVLDHVENFQQTAVMDLVRELCSPETMVFVRCHPWTSRHGGHLYRQANKAFLHVIYRDDELAEFGLKAPYVVQVPRPLDFYHRWMEDKFEIVNEIVHRDIVELFFTQNQRMVERIRQRLHNMTSWPNNDVPLSLTFVDYVLKPKTSS